MGLDVHIATDNFEEVYNSEYYTKDADLRYKMSLSRTFCNFLGRRHILFQEPELDQIGRLTGVDIQPIYQMDSFWDEANIAEQISCFETESEKEVFLSRVKSSNEKINGNIHRVLNTVTILVEKLSNIQGLDLLLLNHENNTLDHNFYFQDFNSDKGDGYIGNNFGQDLRNFKRFIEYAVTKGSHTVYFTYG